MDRPLSHRHEEHYVLTRISEGQGCYKLWVRDLFDDLWAFAYTTTPAEHDAALKEIRHDFRGLLTELLPP